MIASRDQSRAQAACDSIAARIGAEATGKLTAVALPESTELPASLKTCTAIFSCGAAGVTLLDAAKLAQAEQVRVAIDLNAVPPAGIEGIGVMDKAVSRGSRVDYGAVGVGGLKMKIHRQAIERLFTRNDLFLDAEEIFAIGEALEASKII
jgi:hypothetical protein